MKSRISKRAKEIAQYIIDTKVTVREAARIFIVSKSTVHKDITERLKEINYALYENVQKVLDENLSKRHIRGGEATKRKYKYN